MYPSAGFLLNVLDAWWRCTLAVASSKFQARMSLLKYRLTAPLLWSRGGGTQGEADAGAGAVVTLYASPPMRTDADNSEAAAAEAACGVGMMMMMSVCVAVVLGVLTHPIVGATTNRFLGVKRVRVRTQILSRSSYCASSF